MTIDQQNQTIVCLHHQLEIANELRFKNLLRKQKIDRKELKINQSKKLKLSNLFRNEYHDNDFFD